MSAPHQPWIKPVILSLMSVLPMPKPPPIHVIDLTTVPLSFILSDYYYSMPAVLSAEALEKFRKEYPKIPLLNLRGALIFLIKWVLQYSEDCSYFILRVDEFRIATIGGSVSGNQPIIDIKDHLEDNEVRNVLTAVQRINVLPRREALKTIPKVYPSTLLENADDGSNKITENETHQTKDNITSTSSTSSTFNRQTSTIINVDDDDVATTPTIEMPIDAKLILQRPIETDLISQIRNSSDLLQEFSRASKYMSIPKKEKLSQEDGGIFETPSSDDEEDDEVVSFSQYQPLTITYSDAVASLTTDGNTPHTANIDTLNAHPRNMDTSYMMHLSQEPDESLSQSQSPRPNSLVLHTPPIPASLSPLPNSQSSEQMLHNVQMDSVDFIEMGKSDAGQEMQIENEASSQQVGIDSSLSSMDDDEDDQCGLVEPNDPDINEGSSLPTRMPLSMPPLSPIIDVDDDQPGLVTTKNGSAGSISVRQPSTSSSMVATTYNSQEESYYSEEAILARQNSRRLQDISQLQHTSTHTPNSSNGTHPHSAKISTPSSSHNHIATNSKPTITNSPQFANDIGGSEMFTQDSGIIGDVEDDDAVEDIDDVQQQAASSIIDNISPNSIPFSQIDPIVNSPDSYPSAGGNQNQNGHLTSQHVSRPNTYLDSINIPDSIVAFCVTFLHQQQGVPE